MRLLNYDAISTQPGSKREPDECRIGFFVPNGSYDYRFDHFFKKQVIISTNGTSKPLHFVKREGLLLFGW